MATSTMFVSSSMTHQSMVILPLSRSVKGAATATSPSDEGEHAEGDPAAASGGGPGRRPVSG